MLELNGKAFQKQTTIHSVIVSLSRSICQPSVVDGSVHRCLAEKADRPEVNLRVIYDGR
jgi:hypothetical protein